MAAGHAVENLQEETTCAVCLDFCRDPVTLLGCGHNFCRRCLDYCSADAAGAGSCPQCRLPFPRDGFRPNRQLANVVAAVRELAMPAAEELCRRHCQPFTLFCRRNGILLCAACAENRAHRAVPLEEAACEYRERFETSLKALQEEDERHARLAAAAEEPRQEMLSRADAEKQKLLAVLEGLRRVLGEQESRFLIRLGCLRRGLEEQRRGETTELARLRQRRTELQTKCRQTDSDLLRDAQITLSRCTEWRAQPSLPPTPELEAEFEDFALKTNMLAEAVTQFKDILGCSLEEDLGGYRRDRDQRQRRQQRPEGPHGPLREDHLGSCRGRIQGHVHWNGIRAAAAGKGQGGQGPAGRCTSTASPAGTGRHARVPGGAGPPKLP
ncbi:E3 ubiquitin-protein ligase TRIM41-like [Accipiter gentilis]|uniref:E3 ubiquitin-protein ligase TRIM41-like n=1 Tax=Astur gentilis TaxID=8957 RepID=UPI00211013AA|nr:E3 ubiquitin-protein ligase TRIM41-like [Accipiter gentilis]